MRISKTVLNMVGFVILLVGAVAIARYLQLYTQRKADIQHPPDSVSWLELTSNDPLTLTWRLPENRDLAGFMLRYANDDFPATIDDGELYTDICPSSTHTVIDLGDRPLPEDYYFSLFSYDTEGLSSSAAQARIYCDLFGCIYVPDFNSINRIQSQQQANSMRNRILGLLWDDGQMPEDLPAEILTTTDERYPMAATIKMLKIRMEHGIETTSWLFSPQQPNGRLMMYHQGHNGDFHLGGDIIREFLQRGYHILAFSMPLTGNNKLQTAEFMEHEDLTSLHFPLHFFIEPIIVSLNAVVSNQSFDQISMMGISGGGWTTNLVTAIDPRINAAYAVAGGYPEYIRDQIPGNTGDMEQRNPEFWGNLDYVELFILAGAGKKYAQFFIYNDPCCSQNTYAMSYNRETTAVIEKLGGTFEIVIDYEAQEHAISNFILKKILEMENKQ